MRLLLDSHVILWWLTNPGKLRKPALELLFTDDAEIFVSSASWWELSVKRALGRLRFDARTVLAKLNAGSVAKLDVTFDHAERAASLPMHHSDPFDRMLAAQALSVGLTLVTRDKAFDAYRIATFPA